MARTFDSFRSFDEIVTAAGVHPNGAIEKKMDWRPGGGTAQARRIVIPEQVNEAGDAKGGAEDNGRSRGRELSRHGRRKKNPRPDERRRLGATPDVSFG